MSGPIEQFDIKPVVDIPQIDSINISLTNSSLYMIAGLVVSGVFFAAALHKRALVPSKLQSAAELTYGMARSMLADTVGHGFDAYIPFVLSIFMFVATGNLLGLLPYSFTFTSHFSAVGALAVFSILVTVFWGLKQRGLNWFTNFFPKGTPWMIAPILIPIEVVSFLSKPLSLTIRLSVNMMVGHIMLKVVAGFVYDLSFWGGWLPIVFIGCLTVFELMIAILQAYIFTILMCTYLNDAIHSH